MVSIALKGQSINCRVVALLLINQEHTSTHNLVSPSNIELLIETDREI